jgi:hypothetical protein
VNPVGRRTHTFSPISTANPSHPEACQSVSRPSISRVLIR